MKIGNVMVILFVKMEQKKVKVKEHGLNLCKTYFKLLNEKKEDNRFKKHVWRLEGNHEIIIFYLFSILGMKPFIRASLMAIVKKR